MKLLKEIFLEIRLHHRYNKTGLGKKLNKSRSTYARLEDGTTKIQMEDIEAFAKIFEMSVIDVITWPEKWVPKKTISNYENNHKPGRVEENYSKCKTCEAKDGQIKVLGELATELRERIKLLENLPASNRSVNSG